jgi:flavin reductase (DIM6/NTAB) family NADH-FMN oxidoreductase RutF
MTVFSFDALEFRKVLGHYPTGVCVVTTRDEAGNKSGLVVGSFTSISLDPPLVGFFPTKESRTWLRIERAGRFCVNVLSSDQLDLCRRFTGRSDDKFSGLMHGSSPSGMPLLDGIMAWIDCSIQRVVELGDHLLVVGRVEALGKSDDEGSPLLFHKGGYHGTVAMEAY